VPFVLVISWPFFEARVSGDTREHHLIQRPRDAPTRTAFMVAMITLYGLLWAAGGNDVLATRFHLNLNAITWFMRGAVLVLPTVAFVITRQLCRGLQSVDEEQRDHGLETGIVVRSVEGGYSEAVRPLTRPRVGVLNSLRGAAHGIDHVDTAELDSVHHGSR
jgi:ubiquinol-cytochrome c reductase cytochrome b subunit